MILKSRVLGFIELRDYGLLGSLILMIVVQAPTMSAPRSTVHVREIRVKKQSADIALNPKIRNLEFRVGDFGLREFRCWAYGVGLGNAWGLVN